MDLWHFFSFGNTGVKTLACLKTNIFLAQKIRYCLACGILLNRKMELRNPKLQDF